MDNDHLLQTLQALEAELHRSETRCNLARLDDLLHPDFEEYGRSERSYSRAEVLAEFQTGSELAPVFAWDFELARLGESNGRIGLGLQECLGHGAIIFGGGNGGNTKVCLVQIC